MRVKVVTNTLLVHFLPLILAGQSDPGIQSARAHGLAGIGMTLDGIDAVYSNPSGLTSLEHTTVHAASAQSFGLSPLTQANAAAAIHTGATNVLFLRAGQFGFDAYQERQVSLGYAMQFLDQFSAALRFDLYQFSVEGYGSALLPGFLIGMQYGLGKHLAFGVAARNPVMITTHDAITLPSSLALGAAYHPSDNIGFFAEVEKDVDFEARIKLAMEYHIIEALFLRAGMASNPGTFHSGVGLQIRQNLRIDLGAGYHTQLGFTPAIGIVFSTK